MHAMIVRRGLVATIVALAFGAGMAPAALAQSYPARTIKVVVPFTPGSPNDVMARLLTQDLQTRLGQPVVIENKPGGATTIGTKAVALAEPDGYTLLFVSSALVIEPALHSRIGYDPIKDFAPVAYVAANSWLLTVGAQVPVNTVKEFVAHAKANPGKLSFGFAQGNASQLVGERFNRMNGLDITSVPYKGGALAVPDVLGGRIQMYMPTPATVLPLIRQGKLKALAITSATRSPELPDVPTMKEAGYPELTLAFWAGMWAPAGTPAAIVSRLNAAINESLETRR